jgi:phage-related protein (TIGR01555 family)
MEISRMKNKRNRSSMRERILNKDVEIAANNVISKDGLGAVANDAFTNIAARMGFGTPSLAEATEYELVRWTQNYWLMITLFRNHWISRRICEKPAQYMCKAWPTIQSSVLKPEDIDDFQRVLRRTYTPARIQEAIVWARLFGGAGALIVIDGHEGMLDKPLRLDDINPGTYKGLIVFDRWSGIQPSDEISNDINSPVDFNLPLYYEVRGEDGPAFRIHSSRLLRFTGPRVPQPENQAQLHWGISELEIAYEEIRKRDNASWSILSLMFRANVLAQKNPMLAQMLSGLGASGKSAQQYYQTLQAQNELLSSQSMLLLPAEGELQSFAYSFGGIADVYQQFQMDIAGACEIPVSILFGRTATGLGQGNESEIRIFEQSIAQKQNDELRPQLDKLYPVICMSEFGEVPDDMDLNFPPVRVLTEEEKGKLASDKITAILEPFSAGVTSQRMTLRELKTQSQETGVFTNITDEDIEKASDEAEPGELAMMGEQGSNAEGADAFDSFDHSGSVQGLDYVVETRKGDKRIGKDWSVVMPAHYGYVMNTVGSDGDEVDCYIGPNPNSKQVFVVNQSKIGQPDVFDEHKCMIGFDNKQAALDTYLAGHHVGKDIFMSMVPMTMDGFKAWLQSGDTKTICKQAAANDADFNESDHPRDEQGKFSEAASESASVANKFGYKIVHHKTEQSYSTTPGYRKGTVGYTDPARKEIHLSTEGKSQAYAEHYLHHEVGHVVDYNQRNVDAFNNDVVRSHKYSKELKEIAKVFETDYNFKDKKTLKYYKNSQKEVLAESYAIYKQSPERLKNIAPNVYRELEEFLQKS